MFFWVRKAAKPVQAQKPSATDRVGEELTSRYRELGVEAELSEIAGITQPMLVAFGKNGIKTVEDLAGCATDDLHGWIEQTSGTITRHAGVLDGFGLSRDECGTIIMKARAKVGWIDEGSPAQPGKTG
jgi:N utilization substance protein A